MKKRKIEKQLKNDISVAAHSDFSELMTKCRASDVSTETELAFAHEGGGSSRRQSSKLRYMLWAFGIFLLVGALMLIMLGDSSTKPRTSGYFVVDINPSIKISYNENGIVTGVEALNEDADVLLVGLDFSNKTPKEAVSLLFEKCVSLGYFSSERDNNAVMASATTDSGNADVEMTEEIKKLFSEEFSSKKIRGVVITGVQNTDLDERANEYGIDSQKYALILSYLDMGGELDEDKYDSISISELYEKISNKEKEIKANNIERATQEYEAAQGELFTTLAQSVASLLEKIEECINELGEADEKAGLDQDENLPERPDTRPNENDAIGGSASLQGSVGKTNGERKKRYEAATSKLDEYITELEDAKRAGDCKRAVDRILSILEEIKEDEENEVLSALIDTTITKIQTLYEEFEQKSSELDALNASVEETNTARLEAFKNSSEGEHDDVEGWQSEKEQEIASSWYEFKKQWNSERQNDLKK